MNNMANGSEKNLKETIKKTDKAQGPKSKVLLKKLLEFESIGNCCYMTLYDCPIVPDRADGSLIYDIDGKEYIDCLSGYSIVNAGHRREELIDALIEQAKKISQYAEMPTNVRFEFVKKLTSLYPNNQPAKSLITLSGSDAVEASIKLARWYTKKKFILVPYGDFHGITAGTLPCSPKSGFWEDYDPVIPIQPTAYFDYPYCFRCPYKKVYPECDLFCITKLEQLFESGMTPYYNPNTGRNDVAAIIIEPMQGSIGYIIPPTSYFQRLKSFCERYNILLIIDEIQTGLGRTGKMWAIEHFGVAPDILLAGKSLGGGIVPVSAVIGRPEIMDSCRYSAYGSTFGGYALGCAVGLSLLNILDVEFLLQVKKKGNLFVQYLKDKFNHLNLPVYIDGCGLFIGIEFSKSHDQNKPDSEITQFIRDQALNKGVIFQTSGVYKNRICLIPPLVISESQIRKASDIIADCAANYYNNKK